VLQANSLTHVAERLMSAFGGEAGTFAIGANVWE
jgi:hypothetical protein